MKLNYSLNKEPIESDTSTQKAPISSPYKSARKGDSLSTLIDMQQCVNRELQKDFQDNNQKANDPEGSALDSIQTGRSWNR